jgi:hypothetical protein
MTPPPTPDTFHRTAKALMDSSRAASPDAALKHLQSLQLGIIAGPAVRTSATFQACLLTIVTCARRSFLGGVKVFGIDNVPLIIPISDCNTLAEAVLQLGGLRAENQTAPSVQIVLADACPRWSCPVLRPTFQGWCGGVLGLQPSEPLAERQENELTGVFIGALAVAEAFQMATTSNAMAGRRDVGLSLWDPNPAVDWRRAPEGPIIDYLPSKLWLIGLGHLGQAYLWTLGLLPYTDASEALFVLQDFDQLVPANDSTSPLTSLNIVGDLKTRAMSRWCERRGFQTRLIERPFSEDMKIDVDEPRVALCGVDNSKGRACLEKVGFDLVVEAGLGKGWNDYLDIQVHSFPSQVSAATRWNGDDLRAPAIPATPSYAQMAAAGMDDCGLLQLASRSVGAAFVGCSTAALVIGELVRDLHGGPRHALIDLSLRDLNFRRAIQVPSVNAYTGGFVRAHHQEIVGDTLMV